MKYITDVLPPDVKKALSLIAAKSVCNSFQHLVGVTFVNNNNEVTRVSCVAVAPFDKINKWIFLHHYRDCLNPADALKFYQVPFYDVIVISSNQSGALSYIDLHEYIIKHRPEDVSRFTKVISHFRGM